MKICIINNLYPPYNRGGAEQVIVKTVEGLRNAGHNVVVITSSPKGIEKSSEKSLKIYRFKPLNIFFYTDLHHHNVLLRAVWHIIDTFNLSVARQVKDILKNEKPDVVHTHNLMGLSFIIPQVIKKLNLRHIHTVHDVQLVEPSAMILKEKENSWRYNSPFTSLYSYIMRTLMGSPNVVISPSRFLKNFYSNRGFFKQSKKQIIRNPMTFSKVEKTKNSESKKAKKLSFLYIGQVEYHKGIETLIESFSYTTEQAELHIIGDGSKLEKIKSLTKGKNNIYIHGRIKHDELPKLFEKVDMTIVPSLCYENSPTVIFESFAFNLPVIASNIEGIAELIKEGENGLTFKAGSATSLKEKIDWCLANIDQVEKMKQKTGTSIAGLSIDSYTNSLVSHYRS